MISDTQVFFKIPEFPAIYMRFLTNLVIIKKHRLMQLTFQFEFVSS